MEMVTLTSVKQLLKRGDNVELLCTAESRIHIEANNLGIILHPIKAGGYFHPFSTLKLFFLLKRGKFDLIHTQASKDLWVIVPALKMSGSKIPLVLTKQVGSFIVKKDFLHQRLYTYVTRAVAISSVIKKNLLETTPLNEEQIVLVPNGVDTDRFNPDIVDRYKIRDEFDIGKNKILIGMMARFSPGKGHEEFIKAAARLNNECDNLHYMVIGEASRGENLYEKEIKSLAGKLNLNNLTFTGYRSDIPELLAALDIFVFPSHAEAFGIALIEAMAMAKPTVCSAADGILDIAVDNKTSYLFEKGNELDLKEKVKRLIDDPDTRMSFAKAGRERVLKDFNINHVTDLICNVYTDLVKR
jgi:glycosyltransferase involved in cell wall biosynthesis